MNSLTELIERCNEPEYSIYFAFGYLFCVFVSFVVSLSFALIDLIYKKIKEKKYGKQ